MTARCGSWTTSVRLADLEKNRETGLQEGTEIAVDQFVEHVLAMKQFRVPRSGRVGDRHGISTQGMRPVGLTTAHRACQAALCARTAHAFAVSEIDPSGSRGKAPRRRSASARCRSSDKDDK